MKQLEVDDVKEVVSELVGIAERHEQDISELKKGQTAMTENYRLLSTTIQGIQTQLSNQDEKTTKQLTETNVKVDKVATDLNILGKDMAANNGTVTTLISQNSENVSWLRNFITSNQQAAAELDKTMITTKAETRNNLIKSVFAWLGAAAAATATIAGAVAGAMKFL